MLVSSFPSHDGGGPMPLAGVPCDLYMQLLACSSSQSVVPIACCLLAILCCVFYSSSNNDCLLDPQWSVCWFSRQEFTTRCISECWVFCAFSAPVCGKLCATILFDHFCSCCCYSVPNLTFLALVVDAANASLEVEKDPGPTSSNVGSALLGHSAIMLNTQG